MKFLTRKTHDPAKIRDILVKLINEFCGRGGLLQMN